MEDGDVEVKRRVISCLGKISDNIALMKLAQLTQHKDDIIKYEAIDKLRYYYLNYYRENFEEKIQRMGYWRHRTDESGRFVKIYDSRIVIPLIKLLRHKNNDVSSKSQQALCHILNRYVYDREESEKNGSVTGKDCFFNKPVLFEGKNYGSYEDILIEMMEGNGNSVKINCAQVLGYIGCKKAVPGILVLLEDKNPVVRSCAALSLRLYSDPKVLQALVNLLDDKSSDVVSSALNSLSNRDLSKVKNIKPILKSIDKMSKYQKREIIEILGNTGKKKAFDRLIPMLETVDDYNEIYLIGALWKLKDKASAPALRKLLKNKTPWERVKMYNAFSEIGGKQVVEVLIEQLQTKDKNEFRSIVYSFNKIGESARPQLEKALNHKNPQIRKGATEAIKRLDEEKE